MHTCEFDFYFNDGTLFKGKFSQANVKNVNRSDYSLSINFQYDVAVEIARRYELIVRAGCR